MNYPKFLAIVAIAGFTSCLLAGWVGPSSGQENEAPGLADQPSLEIVDQNGQTADLALPPAAPRASAPVAAKGSLRTEPGKLIITDEDGHEQVIDTTDAQSVSISHSMRTVVKDGKSSAEQFSKAIVIRANGDREEYEVGVPENHSIFPGWTNQANGQQPNAASAPKSYLIGVQCSLVSETLAAQLNLPTGQGLVVENVATDSPASAAGIQTHDILIEANQQALSHPTQLVQAVQQAGQANEKISLTLIRGGKEMQVDVTPEPRTETSLFAHDPFGGSLPVRPGLIDPGSLFNDDLNQDLQQRLYQMQQQMEQMQQRLRSQHQQ